MNRLFAQFVMSLAILSLTINGQGGKNEEHTLLRHVLVCVPYHRGYWYNNPFQITFAAIQPLVDLAVEEVYEKAILPKGVLRVTYTDSNASDTFGPWRVVDALDKNELDVIIGFGSVYALDPVARMSFFFKGGAGVPVITSIGSNDDFDNRKRYKLLTRLSGSYTYLGQTFYTLTHQMNWDRYAYLVQINEKFAHKFGVTQCYSQLLAMRNYELYQMKKRNIKLTVTDALLQKFDPYVDNFGKREYEKLLAGVSMMANSKKC